jgi:hypothetical protein
MDDNFQRVLRQKLADGIASSGMERSGLRWLVRFAYIKIDVEGAEQLWCSARRRWCGVLNISKPSSA